MSDWTPGTRTIRAHYVRIRVNRHCADPDVAGEQFDRWLDQVKADAWDEGGSALLTFKGSIDDLPQNPYRKEAP